jgi:site-specific recombinase XerD
MRTDWVKKEELKHILAALMPANRLAVEVSLASGLRITDVLGIKAEAVREAKQQRITVRELKTGKTRRITLPAELYQRMLFLAGRLYVFEHRNDWRRHRTRQAVFKDLKRAAKVFRAASGLKANVAPHSARKTYAVDAYKRTGDLKRVQKLLNHSDEAVTMLYALADELTARRTNSPPGAGFK